MALKLLFIEVERSGLQNIPLELGLRSDAKNQSKELRALLRAQAFILQTG